MLSRCNFNDIDVITDFGTIGTISFGNIATMQINRNNDKFYFLQNNTNRDYNAIQLKIIHIFFKITLTKVSNANVYMDKQFYISFNIILNKRFLIFKTQGLYCHELIYCKWVNLQKPRYQDESQDEMLSWKLQAHNQGFFGAGQVSWNRSTLINTSCTTYKRRAPQRKIFLFFLQDILKTAFQVRI